MCHLFHWDISNLDWLRDFRMGLLAANHFCRTAQPNRGSFGSWIGRWLEDRRHSDGLARGPLLAAVCGAGDVKFCGFADADGLRGVLPMAGLAEHAGIAADRSAWRKILAAGRLLGESEASLPPKYDRWKNPRSHVELLPQYDRR